MDTNIPSLGSGGESARETITKYAKKVKEGVVVDIGSYLGSTTNILAVADRRIHSIDKWELTDELKRKAKKYNGIDIEDDDDFFLRFYKNTAAIRHRLVIHRSDVLEMYWDADIKIGLYLDDFGCTYEQTEKKMNIFKGAFIPNETYLIMMDYYFGESHGGKYKGQEEYFAKDKDFKFIERGGGKSAVFKYLG